MFESCPQLGSKQNTAVPCVSTQCSATVDKWNLNLVLFCSALAQKGASPLGFL